MSRGRGSRFALRGSRPHPRSPRTSLQVHGRASKFRSPPPVPSPCRERGNERACMFARAAATPSAARVASRLRRPPLRAASLASDDDPTAGRSQSVPRRNAEAAWGNARASFDGEVATLGKRVVHRRMSVLTGGQRRARAARGGARAAVVDNRMGGALSGEAKGAGTGPTPLPSHGEGGSYERGVAQAARDGRAGPGFPAGPQDGGSG